MLISSLCQGAKLPDIADSILVRTVRDIVPAEQYRWNWRDAIVLKAMVDLYDNDIEHRSMALDYVRTAMVVSAGNMHAKHPNGVASALGLAFLIRAGNQRESNLELVSMLQDQFLRIPRADNGAVSHRPRSVELWDDSVYMICAYLCEMYRATGERRYIEQASTQILAHAQKLYNPRTGLWYHAWAQSSAIRDDACCEFGWNANSLSRNTQAWGRGNGWIAMAMVDVLALLPPKEDAYKQIFQLYLAMMDALCKLQERETGHWHQLPLRTGEKGNYIESSATAMFAYALAKGVNLGLLKARRYRKAVNRAYEGLLEYSIKDYSMINICEGTCVGERDYYYSRATVNDESFALGALLQFFIQYDLLINNQ